MTPRTAFIEEDFRRFNRVVRRRRRPGECPRFAIAVRNACLECCGYDAAEVERCTAPMCWLYPYRMGKDPCRKGESHGRHVDATSSLPGTSEPHTGASVRD